MSGEHEGGAPPKRRRRGWLHLSLDDVARGAPASWLERPAADVLEDVQWQGPPPDPDLLDAATFLAHF